MIVFCRGRAHSYFRSMTFSFLIVSKIVRRASQAALLAWAIVCVLMLVDASSAPSGTFCINKHGEELTVCLNGAFRDETNINSLHAELLRHGYKIHALWRRRSNIGNRNIIGLHRQQAISCINLLILFRPRWGVDGLQAISSRTVL